MAVINIKDEDLKEVKRVLDIYYWTILLQMYNTAPKEAKKEFCDKADGVLKVLGILDTKTNSHDLIGMPLYQENINDKSTETASGKYKLAYHLIIGNKDKKSKESELSIVGIVDDLGIQIPKYDNSKPDDSYQNYIDIMNGVGLGDEVYKALEKKGLITNENKDRVYLYTMVGQYNPYTKMSNEGGYNQVYPNPDDGHPLDDDYE